MGFEPFDVDDITSHKSNKEIFKEDRLDKDTVQKSQWPAQIDRAALDIQYGIAVGKRDDVTDIGGVIGRHDFGRATGEFYVEGLTQLAGENSTVERTLSRYQESRIGDLVFQLNSFRHKLTESGQSMDIDRALEAFLEKQATTAIHRSSVRDKNAGAGLRQLRKTDSVAELILKLFSDPSVDVYAEQLMEQLPDSTAEDEELLRKLDSPEMTTPLWQHQQVALRNWIDNDQKGYVDMATATGKTVLGLAAIGYRYGELHPADREKGLVGGRESIPEQPRVLIVAGNELLLKQWRDEFDKHLDIPKARTEPLETDSGQTIELEWGDIDFRTAQGLLQESDFSRYDLAILDEAHSYTRRSTNSRRWGDLFDDITNQSTAVLAMSGSVDGGWTGDAGAREALEQHLEECISFSVPKARDRGVIADFSWQIYYAPPTQSHEQRLANQTTITANNYDAETGELDTASLNIPEDRVPAPFVSYSDIRAFAQSNVGNELRESSKEFDMFASALLTRQPLQWNMSPRLESVATLVDRHAPRQKTVVLVQSYDEGLELRELLTGQYGHAEEHIITLEQDTDNRHDAIKKFNEFDRGVIIGPGKLLGVGVNMPDAEVAINIARGGANASLVQRIGRVLRNPEGDKEARFYHIVPQPTDEEALDYAEDGANLLAQAAEFLTLGETFKEIPGFASASDTISETLIALEDHGVTLLERVETTDHLVDMDRAEEHLRRLQADIYDASAAVTDRRERPVLTSGRGQGIESSDDEDSESLFPERNESYEQYRLTLDPYRAAKAVAENYLDFEPSISEENGHHRIEVPDEYDGTAFHQEFERWLTEYRDWREHCDNRDGDGELGSLPAYREEWPAPRENEGVMLTAEAAATIGIDYAESDPIFFPRESEEIYELPLPDGKWLTIDGITDESPEQRAETEGDQQYTLSIFALQAARNTVETSDYDSLDDFVEDALSELLKAVLDDTVIQDRTRKPAPKDRVELDINSKILNIGEIVVNDPAEECKSIDALIETAIANRVNIRPDETETISVTVNGDLKAALDYIVDQRDGLDEIDEIVSEAIEDRVNELL